ncbi:MAG: hypothetical protein ACKO6Q_07465 [Bacteroidota bacterium]
MKILFQFLLFVILASSGFAQSSNPYALRFPDDYQSFFPLNYSYVEGSEFDKNFVLVDFNGDKNTDLACILTNDKTGTTLLFISVLGQDFIYCDWGAYMHYDIQFKSGILEIFSDSGGMGVYGALKMRYDKIKKQMVIISSEGVKNIKFKKWKPIAG